MDARTAAFHTLLAVCKDGAYSNIAVSQTIKKQKFDDRERRFYTELVYGTLRSLNYLDWIVNRLGTRRAEKLDPVCLAVLRIGLYQLFFMNRVPPSAACNEAVTAAKRFGNTGMSRFVNALLRGSLRRRDELVVPGPEDDLVMHLSLTYHQQAWLIRKWLKDFGEEETAALCRYFDTVPPLCIRANTNRISRAGLMERLRAHGFICRAAEHAPEGIYLDTNPGIHKLRIVAEGLELIQDEPSQLAAHIVGPQPGNIIFDLCAAPGGKATHLAALGGETCRVYAFDIYAHKLKLIEENAVRLGLKNIKVVLQDAEKIGSLYTDKADCVLVDAPCSGLGILRHKPDLRWRKRPEDIKPLPALQRRILESAAQCVKLGGTLVYSTCTINEEENGAVVGDFLQRHKEFEVIPVGTELGFSHDEPYLRILPQRDGLDGFFIAKLKKKE